MLFWGGWLPPLDWTSLYWIPGIWLFAKILLLLRVRWVKATVPRYRYDQLMRLGWKIFLPLTCFVVWCWLMLMRRERERAAAGYCATTQHRPGALGDPVDKRRAFFRCRDRTAAVGLARFDSMERSLLWRELGSMGLTV